MRSCWPRATWVLLPLLAAFGPGACATRSLDARKAANALADEFSEMLDFDNGAVEEGAPPGSDPDGPSISSFTAPLVAGSEEQLPDGTVVGYDYEQEFQVVIRSEDDPATLKHVAGAIAFVRQANKDDRANRYIVVEPPDSWVDTGTGHVMTLTARVHRLARPLEQPLTGSLRSLMGPREVPEGRVAMDGNAFHVGLALFARLPDGTLQVGEYVTWNLSTYPMESGDNVVDMCVCRSAFTGNMLVETNLETDDVELGRQIAGSRPGGPSPCALWNEFVSGKNTLRDIQVVLSADPDYQEQATVKYPAGSIFFDARTGDEARWLELAWCPGDETQCETDTDCGERHGCCSGVCRDTSISDNFCGSDCTPCPGGEICIDGACSSQGGCEVDADCPLPDDICCDGACYDSQTSEDHCGICRNACTGGDVCTDGICCPPGGCPACTVDTDCPLADDICCTGTCFDSQTSEQHCGRCDISCAAAETCVDGRCVACVVDADCPLPDDICCAGDCFDSLTSEQHCGVCNNGCSAAETCINGRCDVCTVDADCPLNQEICCDGQCFDSLVDMQHCGVCDNPCGGTDICIDGQCCPPGGCEVEVVLAAWDFDTPIGVPATVVPSTVDDRLAVEDLTTADGSPYLSSETDDWVGEDGWDNPATTMMVTISAQAGYTFEITRIAFEHTIMPYSAGAPTSWELSFMGGPGPLGSGVIDMGNEYPAFRPESVEIPPDVQDPSFVEILWHARGGFDQFAVWGMNNLTIYGYVRQQ